MVNPEDAPGWCVLCDLNVILDVLMQRQPFFADAARLWALAETRQIEGYLSAHSFTTLFYLFRQQNDQARAYQIMRQMLRVFSVAGVDQVVIETACDLGWRDFEDAVQAAAAGQAGCRYLVTRNPRDYNLKTLTVLQPADFLALWAAR